MSNLSLKSGKKLKTSEFVLLFILVLVVEGYVLGNYLLKPSWENYQQKVILVGNKVLEAARLKNDFANKAEYEKKLAEINGRLDEVTKELPTYVSQEEVIRIIDQYAKEKMIDVQMISFDKKTVFSPEGYKQGQAVADNNNGAAGQAVGGNGGQAAGASSGAAAGQASGQPAGPVVVTQEVMVTMNANYNGIYGFLQALEKNMRKIYLDELTLSKVDDDILAGTIRLTFLSYRNGENNEPYRMEIPYSSPKLEPFRAYPGFSQSGIGASEKTVAEKRVDPDFYLMIGSYLDNDTKIKLGQYPNTETEVYSNTNDIVKCKLTVSGSNGKFTYTYSVANTTHTGTGELTVKNGAIRLDVVSQPRKSDKDKVAVQLDVTNNTDAPVEIKIRNDDGKNPRFALGSKVGKVTVK